MKVDDRILAVIDETGPRTKPWLVRYFGEPGERAIERLLKAGTLEHVGTRRGKVLRRPRTPK